MSLFGRFKAPDPVVLRFALNGVLATSVHFSVLTALVHMPQWPSAGLANLIAACFGISVSYLGAKSFVFRSQAPVASTLPRFLAIYAVVAALHGLVLAAWTDYGGLPYAIGFLIATLCSMVATFLGNRFLVFAAGKG